MFDGCADDFPLLRVAAVDLQNGLDVACASMDDYAQRVLIEASLPGEVQGFDREVKPQRGTFDPEAVYGSFPSNMRARPRVVVRPR